MKKKLVILILGVFLVGGVLAAVNCKYQATMSSGNVNSMTYAAMERTVIGYEGPLSCWSAMGWGSAISGNRGSGNIYNSRDSSGYSNCPALPSIVNVNGFAYSKGAQKHSSSKFAYSFLYGWEICRSPIHGDGLIRCDEGFDDCEECDDGNLVSGDGCDENGLVEDGWECVGEPSVCAPAYSCAEDGYTITALNPGHTSENVLVEINGHTMTLQEGICGNFLVGSCVSATQDLTTSLLQGHGATNIYIVVNNIETTLQDAIAADGLCSSVAGGYSSKINSGQKGEDIGVNIKGAEKTLQQAINDGDFCCS